MFHAFDYARTGVFTRSAAIGEQASTSCKLPVECDQRLETVVGDRTATPALHWVIAINQSSASSLSPGNKLGGQKHHG